MSNIQDVITDNQNFHDINYPVNSISIPTVYIDEQEHDEQQFLNIDYNSDEEEYYFGRTSCSFCFLFGILFWPLSLITFCFPCDKRKKILLSRSQYCCKCI